MQRKTTWHWIAILVKNINSQPVHDRHLTFMIYKLCTSHYIHVLVLFL